MRFWINNNYFLSVIEVENRYSCQVMELIHGMGMEPATFQERFDKDIVSSVVSEELTRFCETLPQVAKLHEEYIQKYS